MGKRGNGEGSISRRKSGGWMAQYAVYTTKGRKRKTIYGKTRKDVAAKLATALSDREEGLVFDAGTLTVEEFLERWLSDCVRDTVKASTYSSYGQLISKHAVPVLGRIRLKTLTATHVRGLLREKLDAGLSPRTVQYLRFVLRKALDQAVIDNLIPRNPVAGVKSPQVRREEIKPLSPEQARLFLQTAAEAGDRLEALYAVAIHLGLRQGELLALKWEDVDLEAGTLQVRRSLAGSSEGRPVFTTPKTAKSRRQVRLTIGATEALKHHRKRQLEERMRVAGLWRDHGLVFTTETGTPIDRHNLCQRSFRPLLQKAGLSRIRFHDLRHTCATLLLARGVHPKIVQELLGHSTIAITLDTYSHVLPGMGNAAAGAMDEALG
ncbi:MAG: site-specific integrase [Rubrobacteraceae bacterium]